MSAIIVVSAFTESTAVESELADSDLFEEQAATDKEIANAAKPILKRFFILNLVITIKQMQFVV